MSRRFELPEGLDEAGRRAVIASLERHLAAESPHPSPWVLAGRLDAAGVGALQARRWSDTPWMLAADRTFLRPGVATMQGRGDAR